MQVVDAAQLVPELGGADLDHQGGLVRALVAPRLELGGFELLDGFRSGLPAAAAPRSRRPAGPAAQRARIRLSPRGRRLAALLGRPPDLRIRRSPHVVAGGEDWAEAWVRVDSAEIAVLDVLALGTEVEVLHPPELRTAVREAAARIAARHTGPGGDQ